jgi:3-oxoacyl-[acyl-carrier protein] reductase
MNINFSNQRILITGGSRGLGKSFAKKFCLLNSKEVIITGSKKKSPEWIKDKNLKNKIKYVCLDHLSPSFLTDLKLFLNKKKKIDVLINNAGINNNYSINNLNHETLDKILTVNLKTAVQISSLVSRLMIKNKYGKILNIASIWSKISKEKRVAYSASKSGLVGATRSMAIDLAKFNILVNALSPGFVNTELTKKNLSKTEIKKLERNIPLNRFANTDEITNYAIFLSSKLNTYMNGQNIIVDGGFSVI